MSLTFSGTKFAGHPAPFNFMRGLASTTPSISEQMIKSLYPHAGQSTVIKGSKLDNWVKKQKNENNKEEEQMSNSEPLINARMIKLSFTGLPLRQHAGDDCYRVFFLHDEVRHNIHVLGITPSHDERAIDIMKEITPTYATQMLAEAPMDSVQRIRMIAAAALEATEAEAAAAAVAAAPPPSAMQDANTTSAETSLPMADDDEDSNRLKDVWSEFGASNQSAMSDEYDLFKDGVAKKLRDSSQGEKKRGAKVAGARGGGARGRKRR